MKDADPCPVKTLRSKGLPEHQLNVAKANFILPSLE